MDIIFSGAGREKTRKCAKKGKMCYFYDDGDDPRGDCFNQQEPSEWCRARGVMEPKQRPSFEPWWPAKQYYPSVACLPRRLPIWINIFFLWRDPCVGCVLRDARRWFSICINQNVGDHRARKRSRKELRLWPFRNWFLIGLWWTLERIGRGTGRSFPWSSR